MDKELLKKLLTGLALGDALGATSEFKDAAGVAALLAQYGPMGWPYQPCGGGAFGWRVGQGSDDTDMALCIAKSLVERGTFDADDVAQKFVAWLNSGPRDVGGTTRAVLSAIRGGVPWAEASEAKYQSNRMNAPNGGLIRNGVIVAAADNLDEAFLWSTLQCAITHFHPQCVLDCCVQSWLLWSLFEEKWPLQGDWMKRFHADFVGWIEGCRDHRIAAWVKSVETGGVLSEAMAELCEADFDPDSFNPFEPAPMGGFGSLYTLQVACWGLAWSRRDDAVTFKHPFPPEIFERRGMDVLAWIALTGKDADSYAASAGPLLAAANEAAFDPEAVAKLEIVSSERWLFGDPS